MYILKRTDCKGLAGFSNQGETIYLQNDEFKIEFDRMIQTKTGYAESIYIMPYTEVELVNPTLEMDRSVDINCFHWLLGHAREGKTRLVANYSGVKLTGKFEIFTDCAREKARQTNIQKELPD